MMRHRPELTAKDISDFFLEKTGQALLNRDFDSFADAFQVPQTVTTFDCTTRIKTQADLRRTFAKLCKHMKEIGITDLVRETVAAEFKDSKLIEATYVTHMMRNSVHVLPPYPVYATFECIGGYWKNTGGAYALEKETGLAQAIALGQTLQSPANDN